MAEYNYLQALKRKKLFEGLFKPVNTSTETNPTPLNPPDGLNSLRTRPTPEMDAFKEYLRSEPNREDYKSGKVNKILSAIAGFAEGMDKGPTAGIGLAQGLMDSKYNRARQEWGSKGSRLKELSDLEYRNLDDETKLAIKTDEAERARTKELHDWMQAQTGMDFSKVQADNLRDQIKQRGWSAPIKNEKTGELEVVNSKTGERKSFGQFMESPEQKDLRELTNWKKKEEISQGNKLELQNDAQSHAKFMEGLKFGNDKTLLKFKEDLDKGNPNATQSNAAYEGAMSEVLLENPELKSQLFDTNPDGTVTLKDKYNNDVYYMMINATRQRAAKKLAQKPEIPTTTGGQPMVQPPPSDVPQVNIPPNISMSAPVIPVPDLARQQAIQELANIHIDHPTEEMIQEAMKDLAGQKGTK